MDDKRTRYRGYTSREAPGGKQPVTLYLDREDFEMAKAIAEREDQSLSGFLRDIIARSMARRKK